LVFAEAWEVAATCVLAVGVFMLARGRMRDSLGGGLHSVQRISYGELLFAASVALLFWLKDGHFIMEAQHRPAAGPVLYVLPLVILTLCDAASAIVGSQYGRRVFRIEEGSKSIEGVVVFATTAWLISLIVLLLMRPDIGRGEVILLAFITAAFGALLEAASWRGLDNLFIPLGIYFLLANLLHLGVLGLAVRAGVFFLALMVVLWMTPRERADRHAVAIGFTLFFCITIFSGWLSLITPALAVIAYFACVAWLRIERPPHDNLNLLLVVFALALAYFLVSQLTRSDTIFSYNLSFAALAAAIVARFSKSLLIVLACIALAWLAMAVRVLWVEGVKEQTQVFALLGLGGIVLVSMAGWSMRERKVERPWMMLGGLSLGMGLVALPASP
jgi:dolichol kinase